MVAISIPTTCVRCNKNKPNIQISLYNLWPKKKKTKFVFFFAPVFYLCRVCANEVQKFIVRE